MPGGLTGCSFGGPPPAWSGFRSLRVARVDRESASVISLSFEQMDGSALPAALPGQFLVLRLRIKPDGSAASAELFDVRGAGARMLIA